MDKKKLILLAVALVVAVGTALMARSMFAGGSSAPQAEAAVAEPQGKRVLVAQRALPVGTIITVDALQFKQWPDEMVQDAYYIEGEADMQKLLGTVARFPVTAGQPLTRGALVMPGDRGFLAAALGPGMRAVTITVSEKTGVAGFVFPGDRIDLMVTQSIGGGRGADQGFKATETVLRNLRVLATDQSTETQKGDDGKTVVKKFRTVTLEATPRIAEKISVAQEIGTLSLALRSIADNRAELDRAIATGEITIPDGASPEEEEEIMRLAMNRPQEGRTTFQTGGDVSRFQSRYMQSTQSAGSGGGSGAPAAARPTGPVVRVSRGSNTVIVPAGK
ncbi:Flp pilus assembly protein CpaB [Croceicoccus mobilis]|uniref:SAF domain-containing protein n=1 Tax=Croceicoccus mobilis TaxID=1703339 RepID=A0A916YQW1_9SPHN|nr:Flp pilus assembly protein CpaB [Croceicoccus mobilis]GGD56448.1 hypothetical protein GCM10010990_02100 [Croceicoccus mobilis]